LDVACQLAGWKGVIFVDHLLGLALLKNCSTADAAKNANDHCATNG